MIQTTKYFDMASLSEAAYVLFDEIDYKDKELVKNALQKEDKKGSFSAA